MFSYQEVGYSLVPEISEIALTGLESFPYEHFIRANGLTICFKCTSVTVKGGPVFIIMARFDDFMYMSTLMYMSFQT